MKKLALVLAVATVVLLNVIVAIGHVAYAEPVFEWAVEALPYVMLPSSALLALVLWRNGHRILASLFALNLAWLGVLFAYLAVRGSLSVPVMFGTDVVQLNLYLGALALHWRLLRSGPS